MDFEAYCVKCRAKREVKDGTVKETSNGRKMAQGTCPVCGTKVTRFLVEQERGIKLRFRTTIPHEKSNPNAFPLRNIGVACCLCQ